MKGYPRTREEMDRYYEEMIDKLEGTPQALQLVDEMVTGKVQLPQGLPRVLYPVARAMVRRGLRLNYLSIVGLLDPRLRAKLGVTWSEGEQRQMVRVYSVIRAAYRVLPDRLTYFPLVYHAHASPVRAEDAETAEEVVCVPGTGSYRALSRRRTNRP